MADLQIRYRTREHPESDPIDEVVKAIRKAKHTIDATMYKANRPKIFKELKNAANRGVKIRLIVNRGMLKSDLFARRKLSKLAQRDGVKVRKWTKNGKLHMKLLVIDSDRVLTGSYNWTTSAGGKNTELLLRFKGSEHGKAFGDVFDDLWKHKGARKIG